MARQRGLQRDLQTKLRDLSASLPELAGSVSLVPPDLAGRAANRVRETLNSDTSEIQHQARQTPFST